VNPSKSATSASGGKILGRAAVECLWLHSGAIQDLYLPVAVAAALRVALPWFPEAIQGGVGSAVGVAAWQLAVGDVLFAREQGFFACRADFVREHKESRVGMHAAGRRRTHVPPCSRALLLLLLAVVPDGLLLSLRAYHGDGRLCIEGHTLAFARGGLGPQWWACSCVALPHFGGVGRVLKRVRCHPNCAPTLFPPDGLGSGAGLEDVRVGEILSPVWSNAGSSTTVLARPRGALPRWGFFLGTLGLGLENKTLME
jgi:hypothetical protein